MIDLTPKSSGVPHEAIDAKGFTDINLVYFLLEKMEAKNFKPMSAESLATMFKFIFDNGYVSAKLCIYPGSYIYGCIEPYPPLKVEEFEHELMLGGVGEFEPDEVEQFLDEFIEIFHSFDEKIITSIIKSQIV